MRVKNLVATALILTATCFVANDLTMAQEAELRDDANHRGSVIYHRACAACHGRDGGGDGPGAAELDPWPRDFKTGKYRVRSTLSGEPPRRSDIEGVVRRGMPGSSMPAFGGVLSDNEIESVVTFILGLGRRGIVDREPEALGIPNFPAPNAAHLSDGRALYLILGCWKCHGLKGNGRGPSARGLRSDEGQRVRPRDFRYQPFKGGRSPETVARAVLSGLIGTPMPSHAEIMVAPREAIDLYAESIPAKARPELESFRSRAPTAAELAALEDSAWQALRDENLVSLAHYVLSLSRRGSFAYKLFRQEPELEGRKEIVENP